MKRIYSLILMIFCSSFSRLYGQASGDYVAVTSMEWNSSNWSISNGSGGYSSTGVAAPASSKNVFILSGATVTVTTTAAVCNNLTVNSGGVLNPTAAITVSGATEMDGSLTMGAGVYTATGAVNILGTWLLNGALTTNNNVTIGASGILKGSTTAGGTVQTLNVNGTAPTVTVNGQLGGPSKGTTGESIRVYLGGTGTTTFTGTGKIFIARFQPLSTTSGTVQNIVIDIDMNIGNTVNSGTGFTLQTGSATTAAKTLTINQGKTVTLSNGNGGFHNTANATTNSTAYGNMTYNVNGTLDVSTGVFAFYTSTGTTVPSPTASLILNVGATGVLKLGANVRMGKLISTQTAAINIASGGTVDGSGSALNLTVAPVSSNGTNSSDAIWFALSQGAVFKRLAAAGVATPFWIGPTNTNYNPVTITPATATIFTAGVAAGNNPSGSLNTSKALNRTWTISPVTGSLTTLTFGYNGTTTGGGDANASCDPTVAMKLWYNNGTSWASLTPASVLPVAGAATDKTVTFTGITSFPTFALLNDFTASANASLSGLTLSSGVLTPAFTAGTTGYTANVSNATTAVTITPTLADGTASLTVNGTAVGSGSASGSISLTPGSNTITTVVTAQDGTTTNTYTVNVIRAATFYSKATGDLSDLATYGTATDGTGAAPADFNGAGVNATYQLANRTTYALTNSLSIGTSLNIPAASTLDLAGNTLTINTLTGTGTLIGSNNSSLAVNGTISGLSFASGQEKLFNLSLGSSASLTMSSFLAIASTGSVTLGTNSTLNTNNLLTLRSDASGTAQIAQLGSGATITGNVTVERYLSDKRAWRLICSSVLSTQSISTAWQEGGSGTASNPNPGYGTFIIGNSTSNGFDIASASPSLLAYNGTVFNGVPNTNATTISNSTGYFLFSVGNRGTSLTTAGAHSSTILRSNGIVVTGFQSANIAASGYTLFGNPYAAPLDFSKITRSASVPDQFYAWDINLGTYGGYVLISNSGGTYTSVPASPSGLSNIIASGQAIFLSTTGTAGSVSADETSKANGAGNNTFANFSTYAANNNHHNFRVNLTDANSNLVDGVMASYAAGNSNKVDAGDAPKLANFYENISLSREGKDLTLERRNEITSKDTLFVQLSGVKTGKYQLQINPVDFNEQGMTAYLEDAYLLTHTKVDLGQVSNIVFNTNTDISSYKDRFQVVFLPEGSNSTATKTSHIGAKVLAYPNPAIKKQISLSFEGMPIGNYNITVMNTFGQIMQKNNMSYNGIETTKLINTDYSTGVYTVNIQSAGYNQSIKVIIP